MYVVTVTAHYPRDADEVFAEACQFGELRDAMRGLASYEGLPDGVAEEGETYTVDVTLFGVLKNPGHVMHVERLDPGARVLQSREHNARVARWDHTLSVQPEGTGCVWTDRVEIEAGWGTARFAAHVYLRRHRHRGAARLGLTVRRV